LELPLTEALNCLVCPALSETEVGLTATVTVTVAVGVRETVACADLVGSAELVAVTVTFCCDVTLLGAVYRPLCETEPTAGETDQVTAVFELPLTEALNCWVCPALSDADAGLTLTATVGVGVSVTVALPDLPVIPLVAVTVMLC